MDDDELPHYQRQPAVVSPSEVSTLGMPPSMGNATHIRPNNSSGAYPDTILEESSSQGYDSDADYFTGSSMPRIVVDDDQDEDHDGENNGNGEHGQAEDDDAEYSDDEMQAANENDRPNDEHPHEWQVTREQFAERAPGANYDPQVQPTYMERVKTVISDVIDSGELGNGTNGWHLQSPAFGPLGGNANENTFLCAPASQAGPTRGSPGNRIEIARRSVMPFLSSAFVSRAFALDFHYHLSIFQFYLLCTQLQAI